MLCAPKPLIFAYYSGAFGNGFYSFSQLFWKTAVTGFTVMLFVFFIQTPEFGVPDLLLPERFAAFGDEGYFRAGEGVLIPLSREMKASIMEWGLLTAVSDSEIDLVVVLLAWAQMSEIDWSDSEGLGCFLYDFAMTRVIAVPDQKRNSSKRGCHGDACPGAIIQKSCHTASRRFAGVARSKIFLRRYAIVSKQKVCTCVWSRQSKNSTPLSGILCVTVEE